MDKKRRLAGNLPQQKAAAPVEVGAVWSLPGAEPGAKNTAAATTKGRIQSGHFFVENGQIVAANQTGAQTSRKLATSAAPRSAVNVKERPTEVAAALPERKPALKPASGLEPGRNP